MQKKFLENSFSKKSNYGKEFMRVIYIIIGFLSILIGFIGAFLPILPTTPFLLLASFCFAKGSKRFENWFKSTKLYKKHLEDFEKNKSMNLKSKIAILAFSSCMMAFPIVKFSNPYIRIPLILLEIFKYYYFIFKIKTIK